MQNSFRPLITTAVKVNLALAYQAEATVLTAKAQSQRMAGLTEVEIMQTKGYCQKDVIQDE